MQRVHPQPPQKIDAATLADELADTWLASVSEQDWEGRLRLIGDIHDQLRRDVAELETYCAVSPLLVARLIEKLDAGPVSCEAQAHIYANSAEEQHRRQAGDWLKSHQKTPN